MFGPRGNVTGERVNLYNEELHNLWSLININGVIKGKRMRWLGHESVENTGRKT
jgi:hypothetical protein